MPCVRMLGDGSVSDGSGGPLKPSRLERAGGRVDPELLGSCVVQAAGEQREEEEM